MPEYIETYQSNRIYKHLVGYGNLHAPISETLEGVRQCIDETDRLLAYNATLAAFLAQYPPDRVPPRKAFLKLRKDLRQ